eukprot:11185344-Lingulodinium_polyedra.AAC.1
MPQHAQTTAALQRDGAGATPGLPAATATSKQRTRGKRPRRERISNPTRLPLGPPPGNASANQLAGPTHLPRWRQPRQRRGPAAIGRQSEDIALVL